MANKKKLVERILDNWPAKVLSLTAALILFFFNKVSHQQERFFSVPLTVQTGTTFVPSGTIPRTVRVGLLGEPNMVDPILEEDIVAIIDLTKIQGEGVFTNPIIIQKKGSALAAEPLEISVEPNQISVNMERKFSKIVPIVPNFRGYLEPGYELSNYILDPSAAEIYGPRSIIEDIKDVPSDFIDLSGKKEDFISRVRLLPRDAQVKLAGSETVEFRASVQTAVVIKTVDNIAIAALNLDQKYALESPPGTGSVRFQASETDLKDFVPDLNLLTVDLSDVGQLGIYVLPVLVKSPEGFLALSHSPETVTVRVVARTN